MTVSPITAWRLPGCGIACHPRQHDPYAHEAHGFVLAAWRPDVPLVTTGPLVIDLVEQRVTVAGVEVRLSKSEWHLLAYLARRAGAFCAIDDIIVGAWGAEYLTRQYRLRPDGATDRADRGHLRTVLSRLRARLGVGGALIRTVAPRVRSGYRLELVEPAS